MLAAFCGRARVGGAGHGLAGHGRGGEREEGPINARAETKVPVEVALAKPEPALPEGMPTRSRRPSAPRWTR